MANADAFRGKKLQVHGIVVDGSIEQAKGTLHVPLQDREPARPPGRAAIIARPTRAWSPTRSRAAPRSWRKGSLTADNQLAVVPDGIMAKCPSKYDADEQDKADGIARRHRRAATSPSSSKPLAAAQV